MSMTPENIEQSSAAKSESQCPPTSKSKRPYRELPPLEHFAKRLRELRQAKGWSLDDLSKASEVSRSMLSEIERGHAIPTIAVAWRIAHSLGVSLNDLLDVPNAVSPIQVIRADDRTYIYRSDELCTIRTLSPLHLEKDVEIYTIRLAPKGELRSQPHYRGTREFLTVTKGKVKIEINNESAILSMGDSATYPADRQHAIMNIANSEAQLFLVVIYE